MAIRSFSDIVASMIGYLRRLRPKVDTKEGTFTRDVVIDAPASEFSILYRAINNVSNAQSPDLGTSSDLDNLSRNLQSQRKGAQKALGIITFYRVDIPQGTISIPRGTSVSSKGGFSISPKRFVTTQDAIINILSFNPSTARFEVDVPIRAITGGGSSNLPAGAISTLVSGVTGVAGCYNSAPTTGGKDRETDTQLAIRIKNILAGNNVGTLGGYYNSIIEHPDVVGVKVVGPDDTTVQKRSTVGSIDILIRGAVPTQPTSLESYIYTPSVSYYIPENQPLYTAVSGSFIVEGSSSGTLVQGTHYNVYKDISLYGGSVRAADRFVFIPGSGIVNGETLTFTYTYNSLIDELQTNMTADTVKSINADVLIREARRRNININVTIGVFAGYVPNQVASDVKTVITAALNDYTIGEEVQQSDIIAIIAAVDGVDDVLVPLTTFQEDVATGNITQNVDGNLTIPADSYAAAGTINVFVGS